MLKNKVENIKNQNGSESFQLSLTRIETERLRISLENPQTGALITFEGIVRNHNDGKVVLTLEYEAYKSLAENEAAKIIAEANQRYSIHSALCVHRVGLLSIGETAVFVGVTSAHRDAAFQACRYIIDEIKTRLPIWKKETYQDGSSDWVNCRHSADSNHADEIAPSHSQIESQAGGKQ